ncbi:YncE family protein [Dyella ginsengisoli]|uniref:YncE family protein n=1 Tax=Dyella ginsengisoli TaxID=363848 RepID=A0ABW8JPP4_9GAMM
MKPLLRSALPAALALLLAPLVSAHAGGAAPLKVIDRLPLGGPGGWDYLSVDAPHRHLFVSRGDRVVVVDLVSGKPVGTITDTAGVHGVAVAEDLGQGFTSNGASASVTVFDLATLKPLGTIAGTGQNPDAILYDAASRHVFTFNGRSASASVIDPAKRAVIATITLPGKPEFAQADGAGHIYVNIEDKAELVELDTRSNAVLHTWSLAPCESPSGLALDNAHHRLFSVCDNRIMVVTDANTGKQVATVAIGDGPDAAAFDPATAMAYSSNGRSGTITVVHEDDADHYTVAATVPTQKSARTMTLDPQTHRLYLSTATPGTKKNARGWPGMLPGSFTVLVVGQP